MLVPRCRIFFWILILIGLASAGSSSTAQDPNNERTIFLPVTVTDQNGGFSTQLRQEHFRLSEKKVHRDIAVFAEHDKPVSIAIVIDQSGSMSSKARFNAQWVEQFVGVANRADDYLILGFSDEVQVLCDWGNVNRDLPSALLGIKQPKKPGKKESGNTALYDACAVALKKMEASKYSRRVMILITDGQDNDSKVSFTHLRRSLRESDVTV